ncbi:MAG: hypothetical protein OEQ13_08470 [Acidobacteriota bacterium]|nr:hypothetical protein [Acidobacteriota bacterium]
MKPRTYLITAIWLVAGLLTLINWEMIVRPTQLNAVFATIDAPLGALMLAFAGLLTLVFVLLLARAEGSALLEARRLTKEMERLRALADTAEASRFNELKNTIEAEIGHLHERLDGIVHPGATDRSTGPPRAVTGASRDDSGGAAAR